MKKVLTKKNIIIVVSLFVLFIILMLLLKFTFIFELKGNDTITLNYNEEYSEKGYKVSILGNNMNDSVKVSDNIKKGKLGDYSVNYELKLGFLKFKKTRVIKIIDNVKPGIVLDGDIELKMCPDSEYEEVGYKAFDEYDKDLTSDVIINQEDGKVIYTVKDKSGNEDIKTRNITYEDNEKPKITLKGNQSVYLKLNDTYQESGYTVSDNCSNDLKDRVVVTNNINSSKTGSYNVTYKVKDKMNNETSVTRKVYVYDPSQVSTGSASKIGVIYLTFDDGPTGSGSTSKILDILKNEGIPATFFVTGNGPDSLIKRAYNEGHTVALHTYTHEFSKIYSSLDNYYNDLEKVQNRVYNLTGYKSFIVRFPGGTSNTVSKKYKKGIMTEILNGTKIQGYKVFDWNVDSNDAGACAKSSVTDKKTCVYNYVTKNLSKSRSNIVLMHDIKGYTASALQDIINYGKQNGYIFDKITSDMSSYTFKPNN